MLSLQTNAMPWGTPKEKWDSQMSLNGYYLERSRALFVLKAEGYRRAMATTLPQQKL